MTPVQRTICHVRSQEPKTANAHCNRRAAERNWSKRPYHNRSGGDLRLVVRIAEHVTATPHCLDVVFSGGCVCKLPAQLADEHVNDLDLRFVHATVELVEKHLLGKRSPFAQA